MILNLDFSRLNGLRLINTQFQSLIDKWAEENIRLLVDCICLGMNRQLTILIKVLIDGIDVT